MENIDQKYYTKALSCRIQRMIFHFLKLWPGGISKILKTFSKKKCGRKRFGNDSNHLTNTHAAFGQCLCQVRDLLLGVLGSSGSCVKASSSTHWIIGSFALAWSLSASMWNSQFTVGLRISFNEKKSRQIITRYSMALWWVFWFNEFFIQTKKLSNQLALLWLCPFDEI